MARATYPQTRWATSSSAYLMLLRVEIGRFTLSGCPGRLVSVPLILTSRWTGVTRYAALWSPDFPLCNRSGTATAWLASPGHFTPRGLDHPIVAAVDGNLGPGGLRERRPAQLRGALRPVAHGDLPAPPGGVP